MVQSGGAGKHQGVRLNDLVNISGNNLEEFTSRIFICNVIEHNRATVQGLMLMCDPNLPVRYELHWKIKIHAHVDMYVNQYLMNTCRFNFNHSFIMLVFSFFKLLFISNIL